MVGEIKVQYTGTVMLEVDGEMGKERLRLENVLLIESTEFNIFSLKKCRDEDFWYTFKEVKGKVVLKREVTKGVVQQLALMTKVHGLMTLDCHIAPSSYSTPSNVHAISICARTGTAGGGAVAAVRGAATGRAGADAPTRVLVAAGGGGNAAGGAAQTALGAGAGAVGGGAVAAQKGAITPRGWAVAPRRGAVVPRGRNVKPAKGLAAAEGGTIAAVSESVAAGGGANATGGAATTGRGDAGAAAGGAVATGGGAEAGGEGYAAPRGGARAAGGGPDAAVGGAVAHTQAAVTAVVKTIAAGEAAEIPGGGAGAARAGAGEGVKEAEIISKNATANGRWQVKSVADAPVGRGEQDKGAEPRAGGSDGKLGGVLRNSALEKGESPSVVETGAVAAGGDTVSARKGLIKPTGGAVIAGKHARAQKGEADLGSGDAATKEEICQSMVPRTQSSASPSEINKEHRGLPFTCLADLLMVNNLGSSAAGLETDKQALQSNEKEMICFK